MSNEITANEHKNATIYSRDFAKAHMFIFTLARRTKHTPHTRNNTFNARLSFYTSFCYVWQRLWSHRRMSEKNLKFDWLCCVSADFLTQFVIRIKIGIGLTICITWAKLIAPITTNLLKNAIFFHIRIICRFQYKFSRFEFCRHFLKNSR